MAAREDMARAMALAQDESHASDDARRNLARGYAFEKAQAGSVVIVLSDLGLGTVNDVKVTVNRRK